MKDFFKLIACCLLEILTIPFEFLLCIPVLAINCTSDAIERLEPKSERYKKIFKKFDSKVWHPF